MKIKDDQPGKGYRFLNPSDTSGILYSELLKQGKWEFNTRKNKEEKKDWWYQSKNDYEKNITLLFGKFIPETQISSEEKENKGKYLQFIVNEFNSFQKRTNLIRSFKERINYILKNMESNGYFSNSFICKLSWRMVIGLGASHPQETSMTLHHIYGIPYIPGSAVKGVTRHWIIFSKFNQDEKKAEKDETFKKIFGTQENIGKIIFFDAFPVEVINLKIDIMNPHYPDYYSGNVPPTDCQSPNPLKFLTVENTKFSFYLAAKKEDGNLLSTAIDWLKGALGNYGIGAKTSLGYGIFENLEV